ncbi:T9SS type A sorting domain-containing protein [Lutibacter sp.]|uniref:T9SS type A sorting domain-containing protein n=1 Tax=Lutibacter sp. TaxID=1925666 RepID=UPI0025BD751A|nr:T9SS type A sorting domain-containing protein [Lutibacter sp.]MCF6169099.1 T9SS type A sorting domain-containing protein [Lutibacter sp.]
MIKQLFCFLIAFAIIQQINSQNTSSEQLVRSTTSITGSSEIITINNKEYVIQQSVGQTSAIGTFETNGYTFRQGFIQPNVFAKIQDKNIPLNLKVLVYPNPFVENISISFDEEIKGEVKVSLFDMLGRQLFTNKFKSKRKININLHDFAVANYILKVRYSNRQYITKIIKK